MLKNRLLTAAILLSIVIILNWVLKGPIAILAIAIIISIGAWEWGKLIGLQSTLKIVFYTTGVCLGFFITTFYFSAFFILSFALLVWLWISFMIYRYISTDYQSALKNSWVTGFLGFLVLIFCGISMVVLHNRVNGPIWLFIGLLVIWISDAGAYFIGRYFGTQSSPLAPRVSPKKTWIGLWGGLGFVVLFAIIIVLIAGFLLPPMTLFQRLILIIIFICSALFSMMGDLLESFLKRQAGVKDSGNWLPGHGGFLDRLDSIIAGLPIFALGIMLGGF